jgi:MoaA/NifB/PqqE/SkfB family radical SAM enzyme
MRGYLRFDLADNCNIRCIMCQAYNGLPLARMNFFDFDVFRERTKGQLAEWSYIQLGNVAEATIHPKFADYLRYIRSEAPEATIHIVTNGKVLHRYAQQINDIGKCIVQVSMDSVRKETHEYIREGSNYDRLVKNLGMLDASKVTVMLSFTLMNSNIYEYDEMVTFCRSRGFRMSAFPMILRDENGVIPWQLLRESLWFNMKALRSWLRVEYGNDYDRIVTGSAPGITATTLTEFNCTAHHNDLSIYNKRAILCGQRDLGSLEDTPLETMWRSPAAEEFRRHVDADRGPCMDCNYRQRCLSPSMALLDNHFSDRVASVLSPDVRQRVAFDRVCSDEEALDLFVRGTLNDLAIYDIAAEGNGFVARRILGLEERGEEIRASTRDELQAAMVRSVDSRLKPPELVSSYQGYNLVQYLGKTWCVPGHFGPMDMSLEQSRQRSGVVVASNTSEAKKEIDRLIALSEARYVSGAQAEPDEDILVTTPPYFLDYYRDYSLVQYAGRVWAVPQDFGSFTNLIYEHSPRPSGVIEAASVNEAERQIDQRLGLLAGFAWASRHPKKALRSLLRTVPRSRRA